MGITAAEKRFSGEKAGFGANFQPIFEKARTARLYFVVFGGSFWHYFDKNRLWTVDKIMHKGTRCGKMRRKRAKTRDLRTKPVDNSVETVDFRVESVLKPHLRVYGRYTWRVWMENRAESGENRARKATQFRQTPAWKFSENVVFAPDLLVYSKESCYTENR